jgi:hypothetical protein
MKISEAREDNMLRATGGALNLKKCFTQVLDYNFALKEAQ